MADTLAENLENNIARRASWNAPCTFKRQNKIPIDSKSCFKTYQQLEDYINDTESTAYPGQFVAVTSNQDERQGGYILTATVDDKLVPTPLTGVQQVQGGGIKSISLKGSEAGEIQAEVDEATGHATLTLEEIEYEELHTNSLYLDGTDLRELLPNISSIKAIQPAERFEPVPDGEFDVTNLLEKHNDLVDKFNTLLAALKGIVPAQS